MIGCIIIIKYWSTTSLYGEKENVNVILTIGKNIEQFNKKKQKKWPSEYKRFLIQI